MLGASGLVGGFCLRALVDDPGYARVTVFGRRQLAGFTHAKVSQRIADLAGLTTDDFRGAQDVFIALGTTIRKAGSQPEFRRIDQELPLRLASEAVKAGAEQLVIVSSVGADPGSRNFYLRTKGVLEQQLRALPFQAIHILRPSLLTGKRSEFRLAEALAMGIAPVLNIIMVGPLRRYRAIRAELVGNAMVAAAKSGKAGTSIYEYGEILKLGQAGTSI